MRISVQLTVILWQITNRLAHFNLIHLQRMNPSNVPQATNLNSSAYDVIVIGAGLVGCAMARQFTLAGANVLTIEKGADILDGASKGNSAILHTSFDAPPGSIEQACIADSYQEFMQLRNKLHLPLMKTGALVLAWTETEADQLDGILDKAHQNGVEDAEKMDTKAILAKEPQLGRHVKAGVYVPREYIIDPWTTPYVYMLQAIENGASLKCNCEVLSGEFDGDQWHLNTTQGTVQGTTVINCAGLYGDLVDQKLMGASSFEIRPRKGQFLVYDTSASRLLRSIILPVPNEITKGVVICRTAFGKVLVGPTAEEQPDRDDASVDTETLEMLRKKGEEMLPALAHEPLSATYAGIRPATQFKDYVIQQYSDENYTSVGGIRSTGLSAALGIAKHVFEHVSTSRYTAIPTDKIIWPKAANPIAEDEIRDWQKPGNQGIVCHCERVTEREVRTALNSRLPAASLDGLKRRTRVTMGRCQGFYCSAKLSKLTEGFFLQPIATANHSDAKDE